MIATLVACALSVGCGDGVATPAPTDGGRDATLGAPDAMPATPGDPTAPAPPTPPLPPAPPALAPCAPGWRSVAAEAPSPETCEPWPASGAADCTDPGQAHFVGEPACASAGRGCPSGVWPEDLPADRPVVYVRAGADGGDGARATPYGTIGEAVATAPSGAVIAVARGTYREAVALGGGLALWGACAGETTVAPTASGPGGAIDVTGAGVEIRDVRVGGVRMGVTLRAAGQSARLDGVVVADAVGRGISAAAGASVTGTGVVVRDLRGATGALAIVASGGGSVELTRVVVRHARLAAVTADGPGSSVTLHDASISDTGATSDGVGGEAVYAPHGGRVELTRFAIERNRDISVFATDPGSEVTLSEGVVRDTWLATTAASGRGVVAQAGATVALGRVLLERHADYGVVLFGAGTHASLTDVVVRDVAENRAGARGHGLGAYDGATATLTRCEIARTHDAALVALSAGTAIEAGDVRITRVDGRSADGRAGAGIAVELGATASVGRAVMSGCAEVGIYVSDDGTSFFADNLVIERTRGRSGDGGNGRGVEIGTGAAATVRRAWIDQVREAGVIVSGYRAHGIFSDLRVSATIRNERGIEGRGAGAQYGGVLELDRALLDDNAGTGIVAAAEAAIVVAVDVTIRAPDGERGMSIEATASALLDRVAIDGAREVGIAALGAGTRVDGRDVLVRRVRGRAGDARYGRGVDAADGSSTRLARLRIEEVREAGAAATGPGTTIELSDVTVRGVSAADCALSTCAARAGGFGLVAHQGGALRATRVDVSRAAVAGVVVGIGAAVDLSDGEVALSAIGANVQEPSFDLARLSSGMVYRNVERPLDWTVLAVPDPVAPIARP